MVGPYYEDRKELLSFVVEEIALREGLYSHRMEPVRKYLENHKENLLDFVPIIEKRLADTAKELKVSGEDIRSVYRLKGLASSGNTKWRQYDALRCRLGKKFHCIESALESLLSFIVRTSSLVENLNSRFRNYFTLRKQLGKSYIRHDHWLELLGFELFKQAA